MLLREWVDRLTGVLVDNACRYAGRGGTVGIVVKTQGAWVSLAVEDSGPGIPAAERPRLFDRFHRATDEGQEPVSDWPSLIPSCAPRVAGGASEMRRWAEPGLRSPGTEPAHGSPVSDWVCPVQGRATPAATETIILVPNASGMPGAVTPVTTHHPVEVCVGVEPSGSRMSNPSGVLSIPGSEPAWSITPYCQTSAPLIGSMATSDPHRRR